MVVHMTSNWLLRRARRDTATRFDDVLVALASAAAKIVVIVTGAVATAEFLALPYRSLLAGLGIGGLAIGLAAQDTLKSYFGAFGVVMDRPFRVGDWVRLGDVEGQVEAVRMRTIRVRRADNTLAVIPNAEVMRHSMSNLGRRNYRRQRVTFQVPFATPPQRLEAFCQAARELLAAHAMTGKERMLVYVHGFGECGVNVYVDYDLEAHDMESELRERHGVLLDIMRLAERMDVAFGVPTRTVRMVTDGGDAAGARRPSGNGAEAMPAAEAANREVPQPAARPTP
jgi:MscS family membrane protein